MNLRRGFKRITLCLSIIVSFVVLIMCVLSVLNIHNMACETLRRHQVSYEVEYSHIEFLPDGFILELDEKTILKLKEAGFSDQEIKDYERNEFNRVKSEQINAKKEIEVLQKSFWANLSIIGLIAVCIFAGLVGAIIGFLGTWVVIWFGGLSVFLIIRWIVKGFYNETS